MTDRVVQYPGRYQLVPVGGTTDTFDLVAVPGTVTAAGTTLNKANLLTDTTETAIWGTPANRTVDAALAQLETKKANDSDLQAKHLLYEKIRDITNANGNPSVSVDVSDINWTTYREILLVGEITESAAVDIAIRLNSTATNYKSARISSTATAVTNPTTEMCIFQAYDTDTTRKGLFEIKLKKNPTGGKLEVDFEILANGLGSNTSSPSFKSFGISTQTSTNNINFVAASASTIYLSNMKLWGIKR